MILGKITCLYVCTLWVMHEELPLLLPAIKNKSVGRSLGRISTYPFIFPPTPESGACWGQRPAHLREVLGSDKC